ncbi:MAG: DUF2141 domain-containing protein [Paludibacter sp.]|nr:DUF2141 domain-containing protein [Paludibacter sp.]
MKLLLMFFVGLLACLQTYSQTLEVCITNIRNTKGQLCVAIFQNDQEFKSEVPFWERHYDKADIENKTFRLVILVPPGEYVLSVLDDENSDGKMNYNIVGFPLEGFGFSNYKHRGISKPRFNQFCFQVAINQKLLIDVEMTYL